MPTTTTPAVASQLQSHACHGMTSGQAGSPDLTSLRLFDHLKSMIVSNAKFLYGGSTAGHPRTYDITTSCKMRNRPEYRVNLVWYEERKVGAGIAVDSKIVHKSAIKGSVNMAMEDILRRLQEELWEGTK